MRTALDTSVATVADLGIRNTSNAIFALWDRASNSLTDAELRWFSSLTNHAQAEAKNISETLETVGCLINEAESHHELSPNEAATILFTVSSQLDALAVLISIAGDASYRLLNPSNYTNRNQSD